VLYAFAALKADGSITAWGGPSSGGTEPPSGSGYTKNYKNNTFINIFEYIVFPYIVIEAVMAVIVW
jgi:hypothetical protein